MHIAPLAALQLLPTATGLIDQAMGTFSAMLGDLRGETDSSMPAKTAPLQSLLERLSAAVRVRAGGEPPTIRVGRQSGSELHIESDPLTTMQINAALAHDPDLKNALTALLDRTGGKTLTLQLPAAAETPSSPGLLVSAILPR